MALAPHSEPASTGEPPDYARDHPREHPQQWGWHGEWGGGARLAGWIVAAILVLMTTTTNYQFEYHLVLWLSAAALVAILLVNRARRQNRWRRWTRTHAPRDDPHTALLSTVPSCRSSRSGPFREAPSRPGKS